VPANSAAMSGRFGSCSSSESSAKSRSARDIAQPL
jgi:hypothetical protein